jgi:hypothetical protein
MGSDGAPGGFHGTAAGAGSPAGLTPEDEEALADLEFHWGGAYVIGCKADGTWWAGRRDRIGALLTADSAEELRAEMQADYTAKPVPRELHAGDAG